MSRKQRVTNNEEITDRLLQILPADQLRLLQEELQKPLFPSLRVNPLKTNPEKSFSEWVQQYQWQFKPVPYCPNGYWITESNTPISKTLEHVLGHYYIQDAASMLPVELFQFDSKQPSLILDMAASPGGKTTHLASRTSDSSLILANDSSRDRLTALRIVLQNWGTTHSGITNYPGEYFGAWFPQTFDAVLLDAPCSMQGLRESSAHDIKPVTQKEIETLARRQIRLLESAIAAVKVGGEVVYSTCTLTIEENESVLASVLQTFGTAISIEPASVTLPSPAPALSHYRDLIFDTQIRGAARIWPHLFGTTGFFAAHIRKLAPVQSKSAPAPARPLSQAGWFRMEADQTYSLARQLEQIYGFPLHQIMDEYKLELWKFKDNVHLFPSLYLQYFPNFPVQALGIPLGRYHQSELTLAHEFCTRFGYLATSNIIEMDDDQLSHWMKGEDLSLSAGTFSESPIYIIRDRKQLILGVGKLSNGRLRNLLPRRAQINNFSI